MFVFPLSRHSFKIWLCFLRHFLRQASLLCVYDMRTFTLNLCIDNMVLEIVVSIVSYKLLRMQSHIRVLESSQENISALLLGLEYLINISYVDDTEVFKVLF